MSETDLEILAVTLMDLRATTEAMLRAVTAAQASIEQYRHTKAAERLGDIRFRLGELAGDGSAVAESAAEAARTIDAMLARPASSSLPSSKS